MRRLIIALLIVAGLAVLPAPVDAAQATHAVSVTQHKDLIWYNAGCVGKQGCLWVAIDGFDPYKQPGIFYLNVGDSFTLHWDWRVGPNGSALHALTALSWDYPSGPGDPGWNGQPIADKGSAVLTPSFADWWMYGAWINTGRTSFTPAAFGAAVTVCTHYPDDCPTG